MSKFNDEYYIAHTPFTPTQFHLKPDQKTVERRYRYKQLSADSPPLYFTNACKEQDLKKGICRALTDIMSDGASFVVKREIKDYLSQFAISSLVLHPAIIADGDIYHDDYWYLNIFNRLDCWDRQVSIYEFDEEDDEGELEASVDKFSLDQAKLEGIPEENRLIFKIGGTSSAYVFFHEKIVEYLLDEHHTGIRFFKVSEFSEGDQHEI